MKKYLNQKNQYIFLQCPCQINLKYLRDILGLAELQDLGVFLKPSVETYLPPFLIRNKTQAGENGTTAQFCHLPLHQ